MAVNRTQIQQVIANLCVNSTQVMAQYARVPRQLLVTTHLVAPDLLQRSVECSGLGIEEHSLQCLFDTFHTTKENGMGTGLPICRTIMEAHGGPISAHDSSTLGGARFTLALPIGRDAATA